MRDISTKIDNTAPAGTGRLSAAEFNSSQVELENAVTTAGITLASGSGPDTYQQMLAEAMARYASGGQEYADTGAANAYVLACLSGPSSFQMPKAYFAGMRIAFVPAHANTAPSTVNVNAIGSKALLDPSGSALSTGLIGTAKIEAWYDPTAASAAGAFRLQPWCTASGGGSGGGSSTTAMDSRCRLVKVSTNLALVPYQGNLLFFPDGTAVSIPSAGVTLAATGTTAGTVYYIYAFKSGGSIVLEASVTGHSTDTLTGIEIKTGDSTRVLVGMACPVSGPAWSDTFLVRGVLSYFNRKSIYGTASVGATNKTWTSATTGELASSLRCQWLTWADEIVSISNTGYASNNGGFATNCSILVDGTTVAAQIAQPIQNVNTNAASGITQIIPQNYSEGFHFSTIGAAAGGGTSTFAGMAQSIVLMG